ncbi:MAG: ATP-grasp domain-containing protein [Bacteroidales bacterium]|nr:ATP-grasp domain-containing protein [Bacteroidales bacterium]
MDGESLNILILSCGTRNKIVQYFKETLAGKGLVLATDCSKLAPALYEADKHFIVQRIDQDGYLDEILSICKKFNVKAVLSLIDPELSLLAKNKSKFLELGTIPLVSDYETIEMCFDKYKMAKFLEKNGLPTPKTYFKKEDFCVALNKELISFPVFVKPVKGSASININKVETQEELEYLLGKYDDLVIQEFMDGKELGADVYVDMISGELISIFLKEKLLMRAGETDKSVSVKDGQLFELISKFVEKAGLKGINDIDIFHANGKYYISEVNPRFGGGYPHAYECGVNMMDMILNNVQGNQNPPKIGDYEEKIYMMKYNEVKIKSCYDKQCS